MTAETKDDMVEIIKFVHWAAQRYLVSPCWECQCGTHQVPATLEGHKCEAGKRIREAMEHAAKLEKKMLEGKSYNSFSGTWVLNRGSEWYQ